MCSMKQVSLGGSLGLCLSNSLGAMGFGFLDGAVEWGQEAEDPHCQGVSEGEDLSIHEMEWQMDIEMFLDEYLHWEVGGFHHPQSFRRCFSKWLIWGERRQNAWSTEAVSMASHIWTCRQTSLPSRQWGPRPPGKKLETYTIRCINSRGYQGPHPVGQNRSRN